MKGGGGFDHSSMWRGESRSVEDVIIPGLAEVYDYLLVTLLTKCVRNRH
jgi:hypothetical protein